jgi:hypothetical protein
MPVVTITASDAKTIYKNVALDWPNTRNSPNGDLVIPQCWVGGEGGPMNYRGCLRFDTSAIKSSWSIISAILKLYLYIQGNSTGLDLTTRVLNGQPTYPHDPIVVGDYDRSRYSGNGGERNFRNDVINSYYDIALNPTGIGWINKGGMTKLNLQNVEHDIGDVTYGVGAEHTYSGFSFAGGQEPKLEITYSAREPAFKKPFTGKAFGRKVFG